MQTVNNEFKLIAFWFSADRLSLNIKSVVLEYKKEYFYPVPLPYKK